MPALPPAAQNFAICAVNPLILPEQMHWMEVVGPFRAYGAKSSRSTLPKMRPVKCCSANAGQQPVSD